MRLTFVILSDMIIGGIGRKLGPDIHVFPAMFKANIFVPLGQRSATFTTERVISDQEKKRNNLCGDATINFSLFHWTFFVL